MASKILTRVRPATAKTIGFRSVLATALSVALLGAFTDSASAKKHSYKPVEKKARAFIFNPTGIEASEVRKARLKLHKGSKTVSRRVRTRRVRKALKSSAERAAAPHLKVGHPRKGRGGKLEVIVDPAPAEEPPVEEPPVEEPPVEELPAEEPPVEGPTPPENIFSDASPWNRTIDRSQVAANSATMIRKLVADGPPAAESVASNKNWGIPTYFGRASDPLYTLDFTGTNFDYTREIDGQQIHVPSGAAASAGTDGVIWVVDQTNGFLYAMQQAAINHSTRVINAWKGYRLDADGLGFRYPSAPPTGVQAIRPEELAAGYVNHAMSMGARCLSGHPVAPFETSLTIGKTCSGDTDPATTRLSMGSIVFLDMSHAQIDALPVPTWQKAILKGLADHGAVVGLNGGAAWALKFENRLDRTSLGKPDPYVAAGLPSNLDYSNALDSVGGWGANLKVLEPSPRPCSGIC